MNRIQTPLLAAALFIAAASFAQVPAGAPAGTTGVCKDGTYTSSASKKGACGSHKGVKAWYGAAGAPTAAPAPAAPKASAPAPAAGPAVGVTGLCKDGTSTSAQNKKGACGSHQGVKEWYGAAGAPTAAPAAAAPVAAPGPAVAPAAAEVPAAVAAPGGGPGQVWVNKSTKAYHCPGDKWYGTTKSGAYMSEANAQAQGFHPDHGKACSK